MLAAAKITEEMLDLNVGRERAFVDDDDVAPIKMHFEARLDNGLFRIVPEIDMQRAHGLRQRKDAARGIVEMAVFDRDRRRCGQRRRCRGRSGGEKGRDCNNAQRDRSKKGASLRAGRFALLAWFT